MGLTRFPHGASSFGAPISNQLPLTFGTYFFVDSNNGSTSYDGLSPQYPLLTTAAAVSKVTANKGDVVVWLPGHNENIGNEQIALSKAGTSYIGVGNGALRPRFDFDHANASIDVTASNVYIRNARLLPSVTAVLIGIDVNAAATGVVIEDVEVLPGEDGAGVDEFTIGIDVKAGCDDLVVRRFKERQHASAAGTIAGVKLTGASDNVEISGCDINIIGAGVTAPIVGDTTLSTNVRIFDNLLVTDAEPGIELLTGTTAQIYDNYISTDLATKAAAIVADTAFMFENYYCEVVTETGGIIGTASADD